MTTARGPRRGSPDASMLFLLGATLPFPMLGIPLNEDFVLSFTTVVGLLYGTARLLRNGWTRTHRAALCMVAVFVASAVTRHPVSSYALSIAALCIALWPFTFAAGMVAEVRALRRGLGVGLALTLLCVLLSYMFQAIGSMGMPAQVVGLFVRPPETGMFMGFIRPTAGFSEPSHLAMYLATFYVALDMLARAGHGSGWLRPLLVAIVVISGSLSGLVLLVVYFFGRLLGGVRRFIARGISGKTWAKLAGMSLIGLIVVMFQGPDAFDFMDEYLLRLARAQDDIESLNLVGSEASRINAVLALPEYWESSGLSGFLFGTGYANYKDWLLATYGHLGESATFARGQIDNVMIAVFLSTGLAGFLAFLWFLWTAFGGTVLRKQPALLLFVIGINFSYGFLISGLYWQLLFVLASVARFCHANTRAAPQAKRRRSRARPKPPLTITPSETQAT